MEILKSFEDFLNEGRNYSFSEIVNSEGKTLAHLPYFNKPNIQDSYRFGFTFKSVKDIDDFFNTTVSGEFWNCIYDYDVIPDKCDYTKIDANMKKWFNQVEGKTLYVFTTDEGNKEEMLERCLRAAKTYNFSKTTNNIMK